MIAMPDLPTLWDIVHGLKSVYDFDTTMTAAELRESLLEIIALEANKRQNDKRQN